MGRKAKVQHPAPALIGVGASAWDEFVVRRVLPDGRIQDSDPMTGPSTAMASQLSMLALPVGSVVSVRRRRVEVWATPWEDVDGEAALSVADVRAAEDLHPPARHTDPDRSECECDECKAGHA